MSTRRAIATHASSIAKAGALPPLLLNPVIASLTGIQVPKVHTAATVGRMPTRLQSRNRPMAASKDQADGLHDHSCKYSGDELEHAFVLGRVGCVGLAPEHPCEETSALTDVTFTTLRLRHAPQHFFDVATATDPTHLAAFPATNRSAHGNRSCQPQISYIRILDNVNINKQTTPRLRPADSVATPWLG